MLLSNVVDSEVVLRKSKGLGSLILPVTHEDVKAYINQGQLVFSEEPIQGGTEIDLLGNLSTPYDWGSEELLKETDENPIMFVAASSVRFLEGIPSYIKYITVSEGVLVALVKGCIDIEINGKFFRLDRNMDTDCRLISDENSVVFDSSKLNSLNTLVDTDSNIPYSNYVVNDCVVSIKKEKDGCMSNKVQFTKENFVVLEPSVFDKGVLKAANKDIVRKNQKEVDDFVTSEFNRRRKEKESKVSKEAKKREASKKKVDTGKGDTTPNSFLDFLNSFKK